MNTDTVKFTETTEAEWFTGTRTYISNSTEILGKINLGTQKTIANHRSGWNYVLDSLSTLHNDNGVLCEGILEDLFIWNWKTNTQNNNIPITTPWVGFIHNPQNMPKWFNYSSSPQSLFMQIPFIESLPNCKGFFAFSEYHADFIRKETNLPVSVVYHPTEIPEVKFSFERFMANKNKKIINIGWWLRKLSSIYSLPLAKDSGYSKMRLLPYPKDSKPMEQINSLLKKEIEVGNIKFADKYYDNTFQTDYLTNDEYDVLLTENIAFLDLFDSSANNAIVESIARHTPILVNPLPAVVEYLGKDYPLYFNSLQEAAEKAMDFDLIEKATKYLETIEYKVTRKYFLETFVKSDVYSKYI